MVYLKMIWAKIKAPYDRYKADKAYKKRLEELKKQDPFRYK